MKTTNTNINTGTEPLNENNAVLIRRLAGLGLTDNEIAHALGIKMFVFRKLKESKQISSSIKNGRENLDRKVENALYTRAVGFEYVEVTESTSEKAPAGKTSTDSKQSKEKTNSQKAAAQKGETVKTINKRVIPDVTACIFWLKNRQPDKWRDAKDGDQEMTLKEMIEQYDEEHPGETD